jgi:sodium-dependent dicarboxylate transporter 2/3/5
VALLAIILLLPSPPPLERGGELIPLSWHGKAMLGILVTAIVLWITEVIPFSITAILCMLLIPILGIEPFSDAVRDGFGDPIIAFFIGVLILSAGFTRSGMGKRLSYLLLKFMGTSPKRVILGFLIVGTLLSMWITDVAVSAILLPIGVSILRQSGVKPLESNFGKGLMISCAWGPLFGGIATPVGCGPNLLTISFLRELAETDISFLTWMRLGMPASLMMIPIGWLVLTGMFPPELDRLPIQEEEIERSRAEIGPLTKKEKWTAGIFLGTILLWVVSPGLAELSGGEIDIPMQAVALGGAALLFLPGIEVLTWKEAQGDVDWGAIILICGGISIGLAIYDTGAARWLAWLGLSPIVQTPHVLRVFLIVLLVCFMHLAFSSNTVTGTIVIPLLIVLAHDLGIQPWLICAPAAFASSLAFVLVTETPTNVVPYSAGYFSIKDMVVPGLIMTVGAALCVGLSVLITGL